MSSNLIPSASGFEKWAVKRPCFTAHFENEIYKNSRTLRGFELVDSKLNMNNLQKVFIEIRDIPYSIPLSCGVEDKCCTGKHKKLSEILKKAGYDVRWRVCTFKWSDLSLPESLLAISHDNNSTHAYLEVMIDGSWKKVDATWDKPLENVLPVNEWDGASDTKIAVSAISTYSSEESLSIIENENKEIVETDLKINGNFYKALNDWFEEIRLK